MKAKKFKLKTKKSVIKRIKVTKTGKLLRSHQLRTSHLRRKKSKRTLRRHQRPVALNKSNSQAIKRMLGLS
ncbi:50S ribosomal protein L35 [Candidatus Daviesbacteria bacterium]|nr:50S ribosomal protein L35 [Candidatus Daviesbacteria bacterium]